MKDFKISYVFGKYKYIFNKASIWINKKFYFKFQDIKENAYVAFSTFSGNFHRIYSMEDQKVYFSGISNNILKIIDSVKFDIEITEGYPTINLDIGNQKSKKLLLSLYTPTILTFPYQSNNNHYDYLNSSTYTTTDVIA